MYTTSLALSRLSILSFYLRLTPQKWFRISVWILITCVVVYIVVFDLLSIFGCRPLAATWDRRLMSGANCMDQLMKYMAFSLINIIIGFLTLMLPIPIIAGLQLPRRQKISVCGIFATGGL